MITKPTEKQRRGFFANKRHLIVNATEIFLAKKGNRVADNIQEERRNIVSLQILYQEEHI